MRKTKWKNLNVKIEISENYPQVMCIFTFSSKFLSETLLSNLKKKNKKKAKKLSKQKKSHLYYLLKPIIDIMNENKLVHCFDEINEIKKVFSNNVTNN